MGSVPGGGAVAVGDGFGLGVGLVPRMIGIVIGASDATGLGSEGLSPSSSSILRSWLYLAMRSERHRDPVLICVACVPTAMSAMVESDVSPDRCEITAE